MMFETQKRQLEKMEKELLQDKGKRFLDSNSSYNKISKKNLERREKNIDKYYSGEKTGRFAWAQLNELANWHRNRSRDISLVNNEQEVQYLSMAAHYGYWWLYLGPEITAHYRKPDDKDVYIEKVAKCLADLLILGHIDKANKVALITAQALHTPYMAGGWAYYPHAWFLLDLCCRSQGSALDKSGANVPESMTPYDEVLTHWNTDNIEQVQSLVNQMAEHHMAQSKENMQLEEFNEFDSSTVWLFPYEILAWLKLRTRLGLPIPESYEHPLMNLPQAAMPNDMPLPEIEQLTQVVNKLAKDHNITLD